MSYPCTNTIQLCKMICKYSFNMILSEKHKVITSIAFFKKVNLIYLQRKGFRKIQAKILPGIFCLVIELHIFFSFFAYLEFLIFL